MEWQPIETAPKNHIWILGWDGRQIDLFRWDDDRYIKKPKPYWSRQREMHKTWSRQYQPTHWMPLPEPPHS